MRVIWISVGLFAVFLVTLFAFYEPQPEQAALTTTDNKTLPGNPFVEEVSTDTADKPQVELAVLPGGQSESVPSRDEAPTSVNTNPVAAATNQLTKEPVMKTVATGSNAVPPNPSSTISAMPASTTENSVVAEQSQTAQAGKKPGLAMIMLEKEQQKNKVAVIVHESNAQEITEKEIKALYLDRMTRWQNGSRVMLFNLPLGDKYRDKFSETVLKMTALEADKQEEKRRALHIKANDVEVKSKNVVVSYVEQYPNAIAYVPLNLVRDKSNVKVILTIP